jgi:DNA-binding NarL/FixJ family response regulator
VKPLTENGSKTGSENLGLVWIDIPYPIAAIGLARILEGQARVHVGREVPTYEGPLSIVFGTNGVEGLSEGVGRIREANPIAPILVFGLHLDLPLAGAALRAGARGFIHAAMPPELLEFLITEKPADLDMLSARQREILELVGDGLSNAQIAKKLFLTESTVKQHLRAAYKILGVKNRTEASRLFHNGM